MANPSKEDIEWFRSTFHPIPKPKLPDDCVEYSLYVLPSSPSKASTNQLEVRSRLREIQKASSELIKNLLKDYIWQRESFGLELTSEDGSSLLRGRTEYGDSVEDEWVIVYLLRELTQKFEDAWVKVSDTDGEFLLIEASGALPAWLEPKIADNRVWIHKGELVIIKPKHDRKKETEKITIQDAKRIFLEEPKRLLRSPSIEAEAFYRLRNYPQQINENMHSAIVAIPRKIAHLLHQKPAYISPAVEAFYTRDPIALRPLNAKDGSDLTFAPDDLVTVSVRFTRVGYAQLKIQDFPAPSSWTAKMPLKTADPTQYTRAETGMKLSCGFEMLLSDPQNQDKTSVREIKLVLDDIESGDEELPKDEEIERSWSKHEDDEKWLDISFEDLESELKGKGRGPGEKKAGNFGDKSAQENLQRIVAQFEKFLNDDSAGLDGADLINEFDSDDDDLDDEDDDEDLSSDGEDQEVSFDEEEFAKMMKEMMGMPSGSGNPSRPPRNLGRVEEVDSDGEDDDELEKIRELSKQMEAELKGTGVLDLNRSSKAIGDKKKSSAKGKEPANDDDDDNDDDDGDEDIDINLAKNLLESLKSQAGSAGPAGNLMGLMGMNLPRDERDAP
ncbi:hypothetical protein FQN54_009362 [Arachnomyces sp. PD_36]|nr:hypothetical protein FQN54_009362 [Arachnomyces sp. PD_36]